MTDVALEPTGNICTGFTGVHREYCRLGYVPLPGHLELKRET